MGKTTTIKWSFESREADIDVSTTVIQIVKRMSVLTLFATVR